MSSKLFKGIFFQQIILYVTNNSFVTKCSRAVVLKENQFYLKEQLINKQTWVFGRHFLKYK